MTRDTEADGMPAHTESRWRAMLAAGRAAGLSRNRVVMALRVAAIPDEDFERAVESDDPPTITRLAAMGTRRHGQRPETRHHRRLRAALIAAAALDPDELRELVSIVQEWEARP